PSGVMAWKGGILVTDAPHVVYLKDTNADGRADVRDTLLTGFALSNPHINVNKPLYGIDNWIYLANFGSIAANVYKEQFGDKGDKITFWKEENGPQLPQAADNKNVRFKPDEK